MACTECNKVVVQECDKDLCPFIVSADCVSVAALECIGSPDGASLYDVLNNLDTFLCGLSESYVSNVQLQENTLVFTGLGNAFNGSVDLSSLGSDDDWTKDINGVWNIDDNVGIGTNDPDYTLELVGTFQNTNGEVQIINNNPNITSLNGSPPVNFDIAGLYATDGSTYQSLIYASANLVTVANDSVNGASGFFALGDTLANMQSENITNDDNAEVTTSTFTVNNPEISLLVEQGLTNTIFKVKKDSLEIDSNTGWSGTFPTNDGRTVTVLKGIIINVI